MNPTLFLQWVQQYFPGLVTRVVQRYNDQNVANQYLFQKFLRKDFSVDGKWETLTVNNTLIAADIIAMDSSIPLKRRPSLGRASGDIPKLALELNKREKQLTDLHTLIARLSGTGGNAEAQITAKILDDVPLVIGGQYERLEAMFLEGLSSGAVVVDDSETVGTAIRIDYGYPAANMFGSATLWSNIAATPLSDFQKVLDFASYEGNTVIRVMMDRVTFNNMAKTTEAKGIYASYAGFGVATTAVPTLTQMNMALKDRFGFEIDIVDKSVRIERNGVRTAQRPWKAGSVVFLTSDQVGSYVYARLAEQDSPVGGVNYQVADDFILVSRYSLNRPSLMEVTNSQSRVVPVIDNPYGVFLLDTTVSTG